MRYAKMPESSDEKSESDHSDSVHSHSSGESSEEESSDSEEERSKKLAQLKEQLKKLTEDIEVLSRSSKKSKKKKRKVRSKRTRKDKASTELGFNEVGVADVNNTASAAALGVGGLTSGSQFPASGLPSTDSLASGTKSDSLSRFVIFNPLLFRLTQ